MPSTLEPPLSDGAFVATGKVADIERQPGTVHDECVHDDHYPSRIVAHDSREWIDAEEDRLTDRITPPDPVFAAGLVAEHWGLDVEIEALVGFADSNFRLTDARGDRFVLKIAPPDAHREELECQISALFHLAAGPLASLVPRVVPTRSGEVLLGVDEETDDPRWGRMLTYLEGRPLARQTRRPPLLLEEIGRTLAMLDFAMADFDHPGAHREFDWDLTTTTLNAPLIADIDAPSRRALVEAHFDRFDERVAPRLSELVHTVIHNDGNDYNLLVSKAQNGDPRLAGLIDFGDVLYTATIAELAISCAYLMLDREHPLEDATHIIRGYHLVRPLTRTEQELLPDLIIGRLCTSALFSAHGRCTNPDNTYLQVSEEPMWRLLERPVMTEPTRLLRAVEAVCR